MCKVEFNQDQSHINVDKRLPKEFAGWFKKKVRYLAIENVATSLLVCVLLTLAYMFRLENCMSRRN